MDILNSENSTRCYLVAPLSAALLTFGGKAFQTFVVWHSGFESARQKNCKTNVLAPKILFQLHLLDCASHDLFAICGIGRMSRSTTAINNLSNLNPYFD